MAGDLPAAGSRADGPGDRGSQSQGGGLDEDSGGLRGSPAGELLGFPAAAGPDVGVVTAGLKCLQPALVRAGLLDADAVTGYAGGVHGEPPVDNGTGGVLAPGPDSLAL